MKELDFNNGQIYTEGDEEEHNTENEYFESTDISETVTYSTSVQIKAANWLGESKVLTFHELGRITEKAILFALVLNTGGIATIWVPKSCCSNLNLTDKTVCVWDKILDTNLSKLAEELSEGEKLEVEPMYYPEWIAEHESGNEGEPNA